MDTTERPVIDEDGSGQPGILSAISNEMVRIYKDQSVPDVWRRVLGIVTDGLRSRRDEPGALGHDALTPEQTQSTMRACRPGPR